ncbi:anti-sigma factor family protein [Streptomyces rectiviolaceus]|uniref:Zinc-finger domain-containing protein n=1 Tax=Streptomyces rectiviolaceus TaxID=332591 RepID=A0ABP6M8J1_9ACTN
MTTTTDSAGHPEVAEISDLTEGLLTPSRTVDVRRHLDGCPLCADVYDSLEEIRGMLGTLPGPPRMPADVAGRIDAALAAEALLDSIAPGSVEIAPVSVESIDPDPALKPAAAVRVSRETTPASGPPADRPPGHARAATGPGRGSKFRSGRRRNVVLGAVFTAAAIGLGSLLIQNVGGDSGGKSDTASGHSDSAHAFSEGTLKGQVTDLLTEAPTKGPDSSGSDEPSFGVRSSPESPKEKGAPLREATVSIPKCIQLGIGDRTALAAEEGTYKGKDAYLVVASHDSDSTKVSAYVIDATCVDKASSATAAGKVLLTNSYARP